MLSLSRAAPVHAGQALCSPPIGAHARQLLARTLLLGMLVVLADHRPAHLTGVHQALTGLPEEVQAPLGVLADCKPGRTGSPTGRPSTSEPR
jgi:hypothetical protein